jgi:hypothetical protein
LNPYTIIKNKCCKDKVDSTTTLKYPKGGSIMDKLQAVEKLVEKIPF